MAVCLCQREEPVCLVAVMVVLRIFLPIVERNEAKQSHNDPLDETARLQERVHHLEEEFLNKP
jgi:hypothetical protein